MYHPCALLVAYGLLSMPGSAQQLPNNDICEKAESIGSGSITTGSIANATSDGTNVCEEFLAEFPGLWYKLVGNGQVFRADACRISPPYVSVFSGSCDNLSCVSLRFSCRETWKTEIGMDYFILLQYDFFDVSIPASFELVISEFMPAANDLSENAQSVAIGSTIFDSHAAATRDTYNLCHDFNGSRGLWYKVVGNGKLLGANACGISSTWVSVSSDTCDNLSCISPRISCSVTWKTEIGMNYFIFVQSSDESFSDISDSFELSVMEFIPAANDLCENAESIAIGSTTIGDITNATLETSSIFCQDGTFLIIEYETLWYKLVGNGEYLRADTCSSNIAYVSVLSGSCDNPTCINTVSFRLACTQKWKAEVGTDYIIMVQAYAGSESFELIMSEFTPAPNDLCENAESIAIESTSIGDITNATREDSIVCLDGISSYIEYETLWYKLVGNGESLRADTCGSNATSYVSVFSGTCDNPACINTISFACTVKWKAEVGVDYFIMVQASFGSGSENFELVLSEFTPAANDLCENAESIAIGSTTTGFIANATREASIVCEDGTSPFIEYETLWYKLVGSGEYLRADTCGGDATSYVSIFSGTCDDPACINTPPSPTCTVKWKAEVGMDYFIMVQASGSESFELVISEFIPAANDLCENAQSVNHNWHF